MQGTYAVSDHDMNRKRRSAQQLADEELMPLVAARDARAFEVFFDRHAGPAYSLAYRIVGDRAAAEDVTQEALLSIWRGRAPFDRARGSVRSWALGIVRNVAIDHLRREARGPARSVAGDELIEREAAPERTDRDVARRETTREVQGVLEALPDDQSRVIRLAFFAGFSHSEIAAMLNEPLGTVKGRMRLGMEKIRAAISEGILPT
ncbi:MAG: RNA polymerase sigma factor [Solirubrobacterales bacterium]